MLLQHPRNDIGHSDIFSNGGELQVASNRRGNAEIKSDRRLFGLRCLAAGLGTIFGWQRGSGERQHGLDCRRHDVLFFSADVVHDDCTQGITGLFSVIVRRVGPG